MGSLSENFAAAATWQLKHQVAYWKAKTKALEYENTVLHTIIRNNNYVDSTKFHSNPVKSGRHVEPVSTENSDESDSDPDEENIDEENEDGIVVSEEFLEFLTVNAKIKEEAKHERELLRAKQDGMLKLEDHDEPIPSQIMEHKQAELKNLYGDSWQRIAALETVSELQFMDEFDKEKPMYWPNIPFNI